MAYNTYPFSGNIYNDIPKGKVVFPEEIFKNLLNLNLDGDTSNVRIESIVSTGQNTEWMSQSEDEWFILLNGKASIEFEASTHKDLRNLLPGDYHFVPRGQKHRVVETSTEPKAVWLAIYISSKESKFKDPPNRSLVELLKSCKLACPSIAECVSAIYEDLGTDKELSISKADTSAFTIADGIVQNLIIRLLNGKLKSVVGEEDSTCEVNIDAAPYLVGDIIIPNKYYELIEKAKSTIDQINKEICSHSYQSYTCFIDPIDGTKEFASNKGEQCSICIGFANEYGESKAGIIYRPITHTWALGVPNENYSDSRLNTCVSPSKGFLTSNGAISPFIERLISKMNIPRVKSGGVGNKLLLLLEGHGNCYIQDRGVSRWDTCAAEAIIKSFGGSFGKLSHFIQNKSLEGYCYLKTNTNLNPEPLAQNTKYNSKKVDSSNDRHFLPYSNLCGQIILSSGEKLEEYFSHLNDTLKELSPSYD